MNENLNIQELKSKFLGYREGRHLALVICTLVAIVVAYIGVEELLLPHYRSSEGNYFWPGLIVQEFIFFPTRLGIFLSSLFFPLLSDLPYGLPHATAILRSPSPLKFITVGAVLLSSFMSMYIFVAMFHGTFKDRIVSRPKKWVTIPYFAKELFVCFVFSIILFSVVIFNKYPVPLTDEASVFFCERVVDPQCIQNFVHSKIANCKNLKASFRYPYRVDIPTKDKCFLDNFINQEPLKELTLSHPQVLQGKAYGELFNVFALFKTELDIVDEGTKYKFCESFSDINSKQCKLYFFLMGPNNELALQDCKNLLIMFWQNTPSQQTCLERFAGFRFIPYPREIFGANYDKDWQADDYIFPIMLAESDGFIDIGYKQNFSHLHINERVVDVLEIRQYSKKSSENKYIKTFGNNRFSYSSSSTLEQLRVSMIDVNGVPVYFEYLKSAKKEFIVAHFVVGNTYVQIDGSEVVGMPLDDERLFLVKISSSMIASEQK